MYSKLVSIPDTLMWRYFELLSFRSLDEIDSFRKDVEAGANPRDIKIKLAEEIVARFHGEEAAASAQVGRQSPEGGRAAGRPAGDRAVVPEDMPVASVLNKAGLVKNAAAARDLLGAGSVKVDGQVVDRTFMLALGETRVFQAGKKAFRAHHAES